MLQSPLNYAVLHPNRWTLTADQRNKTICVRGLVSDNLADILKTKGNLWKSGKVTFSSKA